MLKAQNVTKKYGRLVAVDNACVEVNPGELTILLGPNGAGKSTLIKSICGLLRFSGQISIAGHDNHTSEAKRLLGFIPEFPSLYPMLTVYEHLQFIAGGYRLENWEERAERLLERFDMDDKRNKLGKELSKGMQQKVSVCCALLPAPRVVIFDEPMVGLDPKGIRELKNELIAMREDGCALLVSTHLIDSVEDDWDKTYIMVKSRVKRECRRADMGGLSLEETYFAITEDEGETEVSS